MKWIQSGGGPLILVPKSLLEQWSGASLTAPMVGDDYARACAVTEYVGAITVGDGMALVLGDIPDATCIFESSSGLALLRWVCADSEEMLLAVARESMANAEVMETLQYEVLEPCFFLMDSAFSGSDEVGRLELQLVPGRYAVTTKWHVGEGVEFLAHVFQIR